MTVNGYPGVRCWQRHGAKPGGQCSPTASHEAGRELAKTPMANDGEGMVNPVIEDRRKVAEHA
ncbi:hypothetical protein GF325_09165 [Candidatus Bathyarchaeota archaeon]|nr:hypothetical protein [Candidatus Bathyarchaeota archaeon]